MDGQIPLSDLSLTQLYPAWFLRTNSLSVSFPSFKPFILSLPLPTKHHFLTQSASLCVSEGSFHPSLCLCQCGCLYCNGVPAADRCRLCSLFPIDRYERKGETSDWSSRLPLHTFLTPFFLQILIHFWSLTLGPDDIDRIDHWVSKNASKIHAVYLYQEYLHLDYLVTW